MPAEPHPSKDDLQRLTLRAVLALAVRCARRVQPVLAENQRLLDGSEVGLRFAEDVANGKTFSTDEADRLSGAAQLDGRSPSNVDSVPRDPLLDLKNAMSAARLSAVAAANLCWGLREAKPHYPCFESAVTNAGQAQGQRTPKTNTGWSKCRFPEQLQMISDCALLHFDCFSDNAEHTMYY